MKSGSPSHPEGDLPEGKKLRSTLILGYGNYDRQDDGVAWHALVSLARHYHKSVADNPTREIEPTGDYPHLLFQMQLTPELAETINQYDRVCFIDAHTGNIPEDVHLEPVSPGYQTSPFTHHLTPATCLELVKVVFHKEPLAILVSIRGYAFGFQQYLSPQSTALLTIAVNKIITWIDHDNLNSAAE